VLPLVLITPLPLAVVVQVVQIQALETTPALRVQILFLAQ
jgi:hypothetical protein